ncbi:MAG: TerL [Alphaproteobacteria bacterium]
MAEILRRAGEQAPGPDGVRRSRWAVVRNTYPELRTTTIKTWHQWVPREIGRWQDEGPPTHFVSAAGLELEVMFLALDRPDDISKLLSLELTGAWINEAREMPKAILDGLTGRVGRYPPKMLGGASWYGVILDTNSPDSDHWWYRLAEEMRPEGYEFFAQPPGDGPNAENLANLPAGYYARTKAGKDEAWVKVYVRGDYGYVQDGKPVYPEYRDATHCRDVHVLNNVPIHVGIDFGLTPAAVFAQRGPTGRWAWLSELVSEDMGAKRFADLLGAEMRSRYQGFQFDVYGDPSGDNRAQTDETTPFQILRAAGIPARPAPSNDPMLRREAVAVALGRMIDGEPGLSLSPSCKMLRKGMMGGYRYRRVQVTGQERYLDKPDKNMFSHVCEAAQYLMLGAGEGRALIAQPRTHAPQAFAVSDYNVFDVPRHRGGRQAYADEWSPT